MSTHEKPDLDAAFQWRRSNAEILRDYCGQWVAIGPARMHTASTTLWLRDSNSSTCDRPTCTSGIKRPTSLFALQKSRSSFRSFDSFPRAIGYPFEQDCHAAVGCGGDAPPGLSQATEIHQNGLAFILPPILWRQARLCRCPLQESQDLDLSSLGCTLR